jgi:hypothetical protein
VIAILATAATGHRGRHRTRATAAASAGLMTLDAAMLAAVLLAAPSLTWPMAVAIPASLTRLTLTARALRKLLTP